MKLVDAQQKDGGAEVTLGPDGGVVRIEAFGQSELYREGNIIRLRFGGLLFTLKTWNDLPIGIVPTTKEGEPDAL